MDPIEFKITKTYEVAKIERKFNISYVLSGWCNQDDLKNQFVYIEKATNNFDYFKRQKNFSSFIQLIFMLMIMSFIVFYLNSTMKYFIIAESICVVLLLISLVFKFFIYRNDFAENIQVISKAVKEVNKRYFIPKGLLFEYQQKKSSFILDIIKDDSTSPAQHEEEMESMLSHDGNNEKTKIN